MLDNLNFDANLFFEYQQNYFKTANEEYKTRAKGIVERWGKILIGQDDNGNPKPNFDLPPMSKDSVAYKFLLKNYKEFQYLKNMVTPSNE